jgi:hypothetical protein
LGFIKLLLFGKVEKRNIRNEYAKSMTEWVFGNLFSQIEHIFLQFFLLSTNGLWEPIILLSKSDFFFSKIFTFYSKKHDLSEKLISGCRAPPPSLPILDEL